MRNISELRADLELQEAASLLEGEVEEVPPPQKPKAQIDTAMKLIKDSYEIFDKLLAKEFRVNNDEAWDVMGIAIRLQAYIEKIKKVGIKGGGK